MSGEFEAILTFVDSSRVIQDMFAVILSNYIYFILLFVLTGAFIVLLKHCSESLAGYISIVSDKYISVGTPIKINGYEGIIKHIGVFTIVIETINGYVRMPTKNWRKTHIMVLKKRPDGMEDKEFKIKK